VGNLSCKILLLLPRPRNAWPRGEMASGPDRGLGCHGIESTGSDSIIHHR
jgi:hypothetical protein